MKLWELLFTSEKTVPPRLGAFYFLLPTSLVIIAILSIRFASSKGYRNFWYWGQLIQLLIINAWYIAARLPLSEALPFTIVAWLCGLFFLPLIRPFSSNILP